VGPTHRDAWNKAQQEAWELIDKSIGSSRERDGCRRSRGFDGSSTSPAGQRARFPADPAEREIRSRGQGIVCEHPETGRRGGRRPWPVDQPFKVTKVFFLFGVPPQGIVALKVYQDVGTADDGGVLFTASFESRGGHAFQEVDLAQVGGVVPVPGETSGFPSRYSMQDSRASDTTRV